MRSFKPKLKDGYPLLDGIPCIIEYTIEVQMAGQFMPTISHSYNATEVTKTAESLNRRKINYKLMAAIFPVH